MKPTLLLSLGAALVSLASTTAMAQSHSCAPIQSIQCMRQDQIDGNQVDSTVTVEKGQLIVKQLIDNVDPQAVASVRYMESFELKGWSDQCSQVTVHARSSTLTIAADKNGSLKGDLSSKRTLNGMTCFIERQ